MGIHSFNLMTYMLSVILRRNQMLLGVKACTETSHNYHTR